MADRGVFLERSPSRCAIGVRTKGRTATLWRSNMAAASGHRSSWIVETQGEGAGPLPGAPSGPNIYSDQHVYVARVAESADAPGLGSGVRKNVEIRVPPLTPTDSTSQTRRKKRYYGRSRGHVPYRPPRRRVHQIPPQLTTKH